MSREKALKIDLDEIEKLPKAKIHEALEALGCTPLKKSTKVSKLRSKLRSELQRQTEDLITSTMIDENEGGEKNTSEGPKGETVVQIHQTDQPNDVTAIQEKLLQQQKVFQEQQKLAVQQQQQAFQTQMLDMMKSFMDMSHAPIAATTAMNWQANPDTNPAKDGNAAHSIGKQGVDLQKDVESNLNPGAATFNPRQITKELKLDSTSF